MTTEINNLVCTQKEQFYIVYGETFQTGRLCVGQVLSTAHPIKHFKTVKAMATEAALNHRNKIPLWVEGESNSKTIQKGTLYLKDNEVYYADTDVDDFALMTKLILT